MINNYAKFLSEKFNQPAVKQSALLSFGTGINSLLGLVFYVLIIRNFSVGEFGEFSFLLAVAVLSAELGDFGIKSAILKFAHGPEFSNMISLAYYQRLAIGLIVFALALIGQISFGHQFLLSAFIALFFLLLAVPSQAFLAAEKPGLSVFLNLLCNCFRLFLALPLIYVGSLTVENALLAFGLSYALTFLVIQPVLKTQLSFTLVGLMQVRKFASKIYSFTSWMGLSYMVTSLAAKIDNPMIFALSGSIQTGLYSGAQILSSIISQFAGVLDSVFAPKFSRAQGNDGFKTYLVLAMLASAAILLIIPLARPLITILFKNDYISSIPVLEVLLIGYALFFLSSPFATSTLYRFSKSKLHLVSSVLQLILTILFFIILLPKYGALGAAYTFVLVNFVSLGFFVSAHLYLGRVRQK